MLTFFIVFQKMKLKPAVPPTFIQTLFLVLLLISFVSSLEEPYQRIARCLHNQFRRKHRARPFGFNYDLVSRATQCAKHYAAKEKLDHSCPYKNGSGENLWAQWGGSPTNEQTAKKSVESWYQEEKKHDYNGDWQPSSGHFSQIVWKSSRQFGFGVARNGHITVTCALYSPPGNILGQFKNNVFPP